MPQVRLLCLLVPGRPRRRSLKASHASSHWTTACTVRRLQPLTHRPLRRQPTSRTISSPIARIIRGNQIPIARRNTHLSLPAVSSLGGFPTPAAGLRSTAITGRHPKTFTFATGSRIDAPQQLRRYSITSSARASSAGDRAMPSALTVFRLIRSSNLVGCWIGRSAGLAPFRILST